MQKALEIHAKLWPCTKNQMLCKKHQIFTQNYDLVLWIKSYAKSTRYSRKIMTLHYESKVMLKTPEIHANLWPCTMNQKLCKKHQKFTQNYDPVQWIKSYAKCTRNSRKIMTLYYESKVMLKTPEIHAKLWPCTMNQKLCKKHQKFTQNYDPVQWIKS